MNYTDHVLERYVMRTMDYSENEAKQFLAVPENIERAKERVQKLFESSEHLYRGSLRNHNEADIYINKNNWVFVLDYKKDCLITTYKVDLSVGEEFNKQYAELMIKKINSIKEEQLAYKEKNSEQIQQLIARNKEITEEENSYKNILSCLAAEKTANTSLKTTFEKKVKEYDKMIEREVENFVSSKIF